MPEQGQTVLNNGTSFKTENYELKEKTKHYFLILGLQVFCRPKYFNFE
jgi:hypothetical protein